MAKKLPEHLSLLQFAYDGLVYPGWSYGKNWCVEERLRVIHHLKGKGWTSNSAHKQEELQFNGYWKDYLGGQPCGIYKAFKIQIRRDLGTFLKADPKLSKQYLLEAKQALKDSQFQLATECIDKAINCLGRSKGNPA
jgi:hypothetical protein